MLVDLTLPLHEELLSFPGYTGYAVEPLQTYEDDNKRSNVVTINTHQGTHVDAPAHFIEDGATIDELPLETLSGPATVVDLRSYQGEEITAEILASASDERMTTRLVCLTGDVDRHFTSERFFEEATVLSRSAAEWLVDQGVELLANDFLTESIAGESRPVHRELLGNGIPIVEYLCNTAAIVDQSEIELHCAPLSLRGLEAAPARVMAETQ